MAEERNLYHYTPSAVAAGIFVVIFAIQFVLHVFRLFRTRTWFCIPFSIGALRKFISPA